LKSRQIRGVAAGSRCTAAVTSCGQVYTWGKGDEGQLGQGATEGLLVPRLVDELANVNVTQVSCRGSHMAALDSTGKIWSWGDNKEGQLGSGSQTHSDKPLLVRSLQHIIMTTVACGREFTAAVSSTGKLYTWGNGHDGQLGREGELGSTVPKQVPGIQDVKMVACGSRHVVALSTGALYSWGWNAYGQVGTGDTKTVSTPFKLEVVSDVAQIACGYRHSCFVDTSGKAYTWGWGGHGQLGHGDARDVHLPRLVESLRCVWAVACGGAHSAFLVAASEAPGGGRVFACGRNDDGQLGLGRDEGTHVPVEVPFHADVTSCSLGWAHSIFITRTPVVAPPVMKLSKRSAMLKALRSSTSQGDLDAFFAFFMNGLLQLMVIRQLCAKMLGGQADAVEIVLHKVLPGVGATMLCGHFLFAGQSLLQAVKSGRWDWTAQPHGINSLTLFPFLQLIIYPVLLETGDPIEAWAAAVFANFLLALFELLVCSPLAHLVKAVIPTSSLFAALAGTGITFLTLNFVFNIFMHPLTSLLPFMVILMSFSAEIRFPGGLPGGFVALLLGVGLGWVSNHFHLQPSPVIPAADKLSLALPSLQLEAIIMGSRHYGQVISVVLPLGILNLINNLAAIESAAVTRDEYSVTQSLMLDALADIIGSLLGNPFPTSIFIGQPAYKKMGARQGYLMLNAVVILAIVSCCGVSLFLVYIPLEAVETMLVWIGVIITAQAFTSTTRIAAGAVAMGMIPGLCAWSVNFLQSVLSQDGKLSIEQLLEERPDLCLSGLLSVSSGYLFVSIIIASIYAHVEERRFRNAAGWAVVGAILSSVGMIHSFKVDGNNVLSDVGLMHTQSVRTFTATYALIALLFWATSKVQDLAEDPSISELYELFDVKRLVKVLRHDVDLDDVARLNTPMLRAQAPGHN
jgi:adenine/guanine/hypoxanthine permease